MLLKEKQKILWQIFQNREKESIKKTTPTLQIQLRQKVLEVPLAEALRQNFVPIKTLLVILQIRMDAQGRVFLS